MNLSGLCFGGKFTIKNTQSNFELEATIHTIVVSTEITYYVYNILGRKYVCELITQK